MSESSPQPSPTDEPTPTTDELQEELSRFTRQSRRKDVGGLIPQRAAARILGISEARVRALVKNQRIRVFRYPKLKIAGVSVRDVCEVLQEREERQARKAARKAQAAAVSSDGDAGEG